MKNFISRGKVLSLMLFLGICMAIPHQSYADEAIMRYLGDVDEKLCTTNAPTDTPHVCGSFHKKETPNEILYMWRPTHEHYIQPVKGVDLRTRYYINEKTSVCVAVIPHKEYEATKQIVTFLGEDQDAPSSGYFMFEMQNGETETFRCLDDFCQDMAKNYVNKKIELTLQETVFYHEGGENFMSQIFLQGFTPIK